MTNEKQTHLHAMRRKVSLTGKEAMDLRGEGYRPWEVNPPSLFLTMVQCSESLSLLPQPGSSATFLATGR